MRTHVTAVVRSCFATLRQITSVRRSLARHVLLTLVRALVVRKVYYCNSVRKFGTGEARNYYYYYYYYYLFLSLVKTRVGKKLRKVERGYYYYYYYYYYY